MPAHTTMDLDHQGFFLAGARGQVSCDWWRAQWSPVIGAGRGAGQHGDDDPGDEPGDDAGAAARPRPRTHPGRRHHLQRAQRPQALHTAGE